MIMLYSIQYGHWSFENLQYFSMNTDNNIILYYNFQTFHAVFRIEVDQ